MVCAIVLAAGSSKRMGEHNKLLLPFKGTTIISHVVSEIQKSNVGKTIIVTAHESEKIEYALRDFNVDFHKNEQSHLGLTSSIQTGVSNCANKGFMICLGDMVKLTAFDYNFIIDNFIKSIADNTPCIILPQFNGKKGNPVIFSYHFKERILLNEYPEGCKNIIASNQQYVHEIQMPNDHILIDIDLPHDYDNFSK